MIDTSRASNRRRSKRPAFSLLEVTISSMIVGVMLVAALNAVGAATTGRFRSGERSQAQLLADALMAEILELHYSEPVDQPTFGPEPGETATATRAAFDDVDDYHGWSSKPPVDEDGTPLGNADNWTRSAVVNYASAANLAVNVGTDTGIKQIAVTVTNGRAAASAVMVVSDAWQPFANE